MPQKHGHYFLVTKNVGSIPHEIPTPNSSHTLVSAYHQRIRISSHWLTTYHGLHQKTSFVSIRPHTAARSAHSGAPARDSVHCQVALSSSRSLGRDLRRRPGRPRWTDQLRNDTGLVVANLWRQAILRGHVAVTQRPEHGYAMTTTNCRKH